MGGPALPNLAGRPARGTTMTMPGTSYAFLRFSDARSAGCGAHGQRMHWWQSSIGALAAGLSSVFAMSLLCLIVGCRNGRMRNPIQQAFAVRSRVERRHDNQQSLTELSEKK